MLSPLFFFSSCHCISSNVCVVHKWNFNLFVASRVNSTARLSGGLISFCYPVMQPRLNQLLCTNTPTHAQKYTRNRCILLCYVESPWPYPSSKHISSLVLRSVFTERYARAHTDMHTNTPQLVVLLTGQAVISVMYFLTKPWGCGWYQGNEL